MFEKCPLESKYYQNEKTNKKTNEKTNKKTDEKKNNCVLF